MKILLTTDWYAPVINGVVTSVCNLKRGLEARGHEVRVLTLSNDVHSRREDEIVSIGSVSVAFIYPLARLRVAPARKLLEEIIDWKPDVIHSQCEFSTFFMARHIARRTGAVLLHTYHTVYEAYTHYFSPSARLGRAAVRGFTRWVARRVDCMIAPTEKVRALLTGYGVSCPTAVSPSGLDLSRFRDAPSPEWVAQTRRELGVPQGNTVLVCVGRLAKEKGIGDLLTLLAERPQSGVTLLLVGDGPARPMLEEQAASLGLTPPAVLFAGMVLPDAVPKWYALGDLFVSASTSETQGLTYVEALAAGVPLLCRDDDCLDGVLRDGENGWRYQDGAEFLRRLEAFCAHPETWQTLSQQARHSAEVFSLEAFAQRTEELYRERLAAKRGEQPPSYGAVGA